jgi:hypothetical protein
MQPLVSIVMPVYNTEDYFRDSLDGIIRQEYSHWELLVIMDGGPEAFRASLWQSEYPDPRIRWIISRRNRGLTRSRNLAIRCAKGEWIAFCDSDDVWRTGKLSQQWKAAQEGGFNVLGAGFVFLKRRFTNFSEKPDEKMLRRALLPPVLQYSTLLATNSLPMSSAMYNVKVLGKYYFQNSIGRKMIHEDYAYWLNLFANREVKPKLVRSALVSIRIRSGSRSSNKARALFAHVAILSNHLGPGLWNRIRVCGYVVLYLYWAIRKRSGPWQASNEYDWTR